MKCIKNGKIEVFWFPWDEKQDKKCSNIKMFNCLNVSNDVKRQKRKDKEECFEYLDLTYVGKKAKKSSTVWMFEMKWNGGMFWMFWLDMRNRSTNVGSSWRCWLKQFTAPLKDIGTDLSFPTISCNIKTNQKFKQTARQKLTSS